MSCTKGISRTIMVAAVVAALIAAAVPAAAAAPRAADRAAVADQAGGWTALLAPWQALERWLVNLTGADSTDGGGNDEDPPAEDDPPSCPSQQHPGPCTDPDG